MSDRDSERLAKLREPLPLWGALEIKRLTRERDDAVAALSSLAAEAILLIGHGARQTRNLESAIDKAGEIVERAAQPGAEPTKELTHPVTGDKVHLSPRTGAIVRTETATPQPAPDHAETARALAEEAAPRRAMTEPIKEALDVATECATEDGPGGPHLAMPGHQIKRVAAALVRFGEAAARDAERAAYERIDQRLPHGWMYEAKRYYNLPWADCGYAKVWSPHIDDSPVEIYARTPLQALQQAIDSALSAPAPSQQEGE